MISSPNKFAVFDMLKLVQAQTLSPQSAENVARMLCIDVIGFCFPKKFIVTDMMTFSSSSHVYQLIELTSLVVLCYLSKNVYKAQFDYVDHILFRCSNLISTPCPMLHS